MPQSARPAADANAARAPIGAPVLRADTLRKYEEVAASALLGGGQRKVVRANDSLSFEAYESETRAIVGESGCGKSALAKVLMGLETATGGTVTFGNAQVQDTPIDARGTRIVADMQMVFQNPFDRLNPSMRVGRPIIRALEDFGYGKSAAVRHARMLELLDLVGLPRAFAGDARGVVADEPVSALDVSVQAAVTDLLMDIQRQQKTTLLFISHDLSIMRHIADRIVVMDLGPVIELAGDRRDSAHPETRRISGVRCGQAPAAKTQGHRRRGLHTPKRFFIPTGATSRASCVSPAEMRARRASNVE